MATKDPTLIRPTRATLQAMALRLRTEARALALLELISPRRAPSMEEVWAAEDAAKKQKAPAKKARAKTAAKR